MIYLTTGQPGAGKTLWTLNYVKQLAEKENRQVYHNGITDLAIPGWIHLEKPDEWHELPAGSIILLDEAQRLFRPRGVGSQVPHYVQALETHRHKGHDLFVITQHPMLVESNLRRLVGKHWHVMRTFGMNRATVHEFTELKQEPDKTREGSIRHEWNYPKESFSWYKSAEVHTHKKSIPVRVYMLLAIPLLLGGLAFAAYQMLDPDRLTEKLSGGEPQAAAADPQPVKRTGQPVSPADYINASKPRVAGLLHTAPRYDELMQPVSAPKPVACMESPSKGCSCYSQQGTRLPVDVNLCRQIISTGWFDETQLTLYSRPANGSDLGKPVGRPSAGPEANTGV